MINSILLAIGLRATARFPDWTGSFVNDAKDISLRIFANPKNEGIYELAQGAPIKLPKEKRHVDFENGDFIAKGERLLLDGNFTFRSPNRSPYFELFLGGLHYNYESEIPDKKKQKQFLSELKWRVKNSGKKRTVLIRHTAGGVELVMNGILLSKVQEKQ